MMLYSTSAAYAIKALTYLAKEQEQGYQTVGYIAQEIEAPKQFLGKIFQDLSKKGILQSQKGRGGGFKLSRDSNQISLLQVVRLIDGEDVFQTCPFNLDECDDQDYCPLHEDWNPIRSKIVEFLETKTIGDLQQN